METGPLVLWRELAGYLSMAAFPSLPIAERDLVRGREKREL